MAIAFGASTLCVEQQDGLELNKPEKTMQEKVAEYYVKTKQTLWNHRYKILAVTSVVALAGLAYWYKASIVAFLGYDVSKASEVKQNATEDSLPKTVPTEEIVQPAKPLQAEPLIAKPDTTSEALEPEIAATPASEATTSVSAPSEKTENGAGDVASAPSATTTLQSVPTDIPVEVQPDKILPTQTESVTALPEATAVENNVQPVEAELKQTLLAEDTNSVMPEAQLAPAADVPTVPVLTQEQPSAESVPAAPTESTEHNVLVPNEQPAMPNDDLPKTNVAPDGEELQQAPAATDEMVDVNWEDQSGVEDYILKNAKRLENTVDEQATAENLP